MRGEEANLDEAEIERLAHARELARGYREAARRALTFARRYRDEERTPGGARERACIAQAQLWRRAVRELHAALPITAPPESARPGLARARDEAPASSGRKTG